MHEFAIPGIIAVFALLFHLARALRMPSAISFGPFRTREEAERFAKKLREGWDEG